VNPSEYYEYAERGHVYDEYREGYGGNASTATTPVALAIAGLGIVSGSAIPGAEWLLDWRDGKKTFHENGLHCLLRT
jgi:hypothetical protein